MSAPLTSTSAIEPFVCPRPIDASCQCAVCLHIGVTDQRLLSPPPVFHSYQIVRVGPNNEQVEASYADYEYLEKNFPKSALWTHDQASQPWHKALLKIVRTLIKDKRISYPFCQPVDVVALNIPDYYNVIRHPMDLGTIESNMTNGIYHHPEQVVNDVRLVFRNCYVYNKAEHAVTIMAREMSYNFEKALAAL